MMKRRIPLLAAAAVLAATALTAAAPAVSAAAASASDLVLMHPQIQEREGMSRQEFEKFRMERLKEMAAYFGISTDGKSAEQLKKELNAAKAADKEKWEAFKAEHKAKRLEHLQKIAEEHGIRTEGKSARELHDELSKLHGGKGFPRFKKPDGDTRGEKPQPQPTMPPAPTQQPAPTGKPELKQQSPGKLDIQQQTPGKLDIQQQTPGKTDLKQPQTKPEMSGKQPDQSKVNPEMKEQGSKAPESGKGKAD